MPAAARARLKAWLSFAARYLLGFLLVYWLLRTQVLDLGPLKSISATLVVQGLFLGISITAISTFRIRYLMSDQGINVSYRRCFLYNSIGLFYSLFLPGGLSGDAARAYYFFKDAPQKRIAVLGALLLDRFLGLIALIAFGILSGIFLASMIREVVPYLVASAIVLGVLVAGLVLGVRYEIQHRSTADAHWLLRLWEAVRKIVARMHLTEYSTRTLVVSVALSVLMNVLMIVLMYLCSVLNESGLGFMEVSAVSPLGLLTNAIPLSPGGLGVGEKSFDVLYKAVGGSNGAGSFLTTRIFLYCPAVIGGLCAAFLLLRSHYSSLVRRQKS